VDECAALSYGIPEYGLPAPGMYDYMSPDYMMAGQGQLPLSQQQVYQAGTSNP
jgi:hypothetical protein